MLSPLLMNIAPCSKHFPVEEESKRGANERPQFYGTFASSLRAFFSFFGEPAFFIIKNEKIAIAN
jgi:hypothetical protein